MIPQAEILFVMLTSFFVGFYNGHSSRTFGSPQFDNQQGGSIVSLLAGILAHRSTIGQYDVTYKYSFVPVLGIPTISRSSEIGYDRYASVGHRILCDNFALATCRVCHSRAWQSSYG